MPDAARSVSFHPAAFAELLAAHDWYLARSTTAAAEFVDEIERAVSRIQEAPERYPETRHQRRRFVLLSFPFAVVYRLTPTHIEILAVAHHSRRPGYWRSR
jgi:plasmid stabilization system protein ParE